MPNGCWEWTAGTTNDGYGRFYNGKKFIRAHRWAYEHFVGPIMEGMCVCHRCDNRKCVNPEHLWVGTNADNIADRVTKGRSARGKKHSETICHQLQMHPELIAKGDRNGSKTCPESRPRGECHYKAKLTSEIVVKARGEYASGQYSFQQLADKYGVTRCAISHAINGRTWKHI